MHVDVYQSEGGTASRTEMVNFFLVLVVVLVVVVLVPRGLRTAQRQN